MKTSTRSILGLVMVCAVAALVVGCQGASPLSPEGQAVVIRGTVFGGSAAAGGSAQSLHGSSASAAAAATITVSLLGNPSVTATVAADGSFTLRGLPPGEFTLVFYADGKEIGRLAFGSVLPNQEITIVVDVAGNIVTLLDEKRTGIGHGDIEIEGVIERVLTVDVNGESQFLVSGYTVVTRPGQTAIRQGNTARTVLDLTAGRQVHVKGVFDTTADRFGSQHILAQEIVLQDATGNTDPGGGGGGQACMINGGTAGQGIELEGTVADGAGASFRLQVNGNRARQPVQVDAGGAVFQCHPSSGPNAVPADQCKAQVKGGTQVHVSGLLASCDTQAARVTASKVIVQK